MQPRTGRPIVPHVQHTGMPISSGTGTYNHEFKPVTPRVASLGNSGGGMSVAQPVVARPLASYRPVAAASNSPNFSSSSSPPSSDPFERKGVISTTLAEARALVQQMDNSRYNSSSANRPASLIEPSRPFTPRVSRRGSSNSSPYTQMMRPPSPSASPSSNHIPFPYPAIHAFDGSNSGAGMGPSGSPPDSPSIHTTMANRSIASIIAKEEEEEELIIRSKKSSGLVRQRSFSRFSEDGSNGMGELDQMRSDSRPDSATLNRSRSASTASPMMMLSASSRKSPFQPSQSPPPTNIAVPELAFPQSVGNEDDWKFVENSAGDETSRPGTAVPLQGWQSRQGSAGTTRAVQISQQLHVLHHHQQQQQAKESLQTSPQPRPPSGSPGSGTGRRSRPNSSSTGAIGAADKDGTATTNSRPTSSTSSTSTNSSIPSRPSSSSQSIKDQTTDNTAVLTNASPTPPPGPVSTTRPSSALFSRPLDVKTPATNHVAATQGDVKEDAVPTEKILDLAALKSLHEIYLSAAPLERPDALQNVLTASYRSLRAIQNLASPELEPLLSFVLELPPSIGAGDKLVLLISRLIFELSRDASNDAILVRMGPLVISSILSKPQRGLRALSFILGAFHNLSVEASNNNTAKPEQVSLLIAPSMMEALINLMRENTLTKTLKLETEEEQVRLLVEVTALLRNIACINGAHRLFVTPSTAQSTSPTSASANSPPTSCLDLLCQLTVRLSQHSSLLLNLSRILSKLSLHQSCRAVMYQPILATASASSSSKQPQGFIPALVSSLQLHHVKLSLCVRVLYILGNLTMQNDVCRREIVECSCVAVPPAAGSKDASSEAATDSAADGSATAGADVKGLEVLLALFARSYQRDSKLRKLIAGTAAVPPSATAAASPAVAAAAASANQKKHVSMLKENEDLLVKLIRLLANLSINPSIGSVVLNDKRCGFLLKLLKYKSLESAEELVLNTVSALTNLSFYLKMKPSGDSSRPPSAGTSAAAAAAASNASRPASATTLSKDGLIFFHPPRDVLALLLNYLFCSHVELLSEVCRALGNFSRDLSFRLLMQQARVDEAIILLLDHSDTGVVYGAAGVALNMAAHVQGQESLFQHDNAGVERLIEVMERFALHHQPEDAENGVAEAEEENQAEWPLISMILKTFLNLRAVAPSANNGSGSSPSASLILKREVNADGRMHLLEVLEAILDRLEHELNSLRVALSEVSSSDSDTDAESETSSIQAAIQQLSEVETLAQQLMPACIIPPQWQ